MKGAWREIRDAVQLEALGFVTVGIVQDLGVMVHQLRTALRMIACHPQVRPIAGFFPVASDATMSLEQARTLIQRLLAIAQSDQIAPEQVDLPMCLARLEPVLRRICGRDVELTMVISVDLPSPICRRRSLENAVLNLVLNARDATPPGGEIVVRGRTANDPIVGDCVSLSVADNGVGMAPETCARAFEPFFTTKAGGNGLGLSTVGRFAHDAGGYATIESYPGEGTVVSMHLPVSGVG